MDRRVACPSALAGTRYINRKTMKLRITGKGDTRVTNTAAYETNVRVISRVKSDVVYINNTRFIRLQQRLHELWKRFMSVSIRTGQEGASRQH